jgi:transcription antitermination factor NusG
MPCYVIYTKANNEKNVASLLSKNFNVYCPLFDTIKQWSDRKKKVRIPLFRSYIFIFLDDYINQRNSVLSVPGAVRFLWWAGKPAIVREVEIEAIRNFLDEYKDVKISVNFNPGDVITIKEGPFRGHSGELISIRGNKAILELKSFGWHLTAEISVALL